MLNSIRVVETTISTTHCVFIFTNGKMWIMKKIKYGGTSLLISFALFYVKELLVHMRVWYVITDIVIFVSEFFGMNGLIILLEDDIDNEE